MAHKCPQHCHRCPDMGGDVMPGCMGTAALGRHGKDKSFCTCHKVRSYDAPADETRMASLEKRISDLEKRQPV
jgi:hypothetical protein